MQEEVMCGRPSWPAALRCLALAALLMALGGCGVDEEVPFELLEGSEGAVCGYRTPVGVSPEGRWLVYEDRSDGLVLLDRTPDAGAGTRWVPEVTAEARMRIDGGRPPDLLTLCWSEDGTEGVLEGSRIPAQDPAQPRVLNVFSLSLPGTGARDTATLPPQLGTRDSTACVTRPGRAWDLWTEGRPVSPGTGYPAAFPEPGPPDPVVTRGSTVLQGVEERRGARIVDAEGRTLAQVRPPWFLSIGGEAIVTSFAWSPDGSRLAWVSRRQRFGTWGGQSRMHLREADGTVRTLGPPSPRRPEIVWASNMELLACLAEEPGRIVRLQP